MPVIKLQDLPKEKEFEEFVSAFFQANGFYVEHNIIDRKIEEVLEFDFVTTDYYKSPPRIILLEIKSGGWGFSDLFKIRGWMDYTSLEEGLLVASGTRENIDFVIQISSSLNIGVTTLPDLKKTSEYLSGYLHNKPIDNRDIEIWRFTYWLARIMLDRLNKKKKSIQDKEGYRTLAYYHHQVNSGIFFTRNIVERIDKLYGLFKTNSKISAKLAHELNGESFHDEHDKIPKNIFNETFYKCKYTDIQISTFIEHKARITILKNAVDYKLYKMAHDSERTNVAVYKILGVQFSDFDLLPQGFIEGLEKISEHKYFHLYPVFWQWFLWAFGAFILKDIEEKEFKLLSEKTGIPINEIHNALLAYDLLFPRSEDGWFQIIPNTNIQILKLFPIPFRGIGANLRRFYYSEKHEFQELQNMLSGRYTYSELIKWNNLTVEVLSKDSKNQNQFTPIEPSSKEFNPLD